MYVYMYSLSQKAQQTSKLSVRYTLLANKFLYANLYIKRCKLPTKLNFQLQQNSLLNFEEPKCSIKSQEKILSLCWLLAKVKKLNLPIRFSKSEVPVCCSVKHLGKVILARDRKGLSDMYSYSVLCTLQPLASSLLQSTQTVKGMKGKMISLKKAFPAYKLSYTSSERQVRLNA